MSTPLSPTQPPATNIRAFSSDRTSKDEDIEFFPESELAPPVGSGGVVAISENAFEKEAVSFGIL